ncbi:hypothetical protein QA635_19585 [Bradyrhizobium brasilense]|uniref:hypothetical protein n=1 Tax=Bradyrhizobium brasilense TaxID=1419277 RepID=UPI0024B094EA|nr:hypothetical protein [Bradyrhizobium australafricanum]WFU36495.1 hypothetical protein QA635_19585 [Bradyrhizobium australafricanum]
MDYAVLSGDQQLISVFPADTFARAVEIKNHIQASYNKHYGCAEIFTVRKATRTERRRMRKETVGFIAAAK